MADSKEEFLSTSNSKKRISPNTLNGISYPKYFAILALACFIGVFAVSALLFLKGQGPIYKLDGLSQSLNRLIYEGNALRSAFASFIAGNGFDLPQFIFHPGFGASATSVIRTRDPLGWFSVFVPGKYMEYYYYVLIFLRTFLCAAAFSVYCFGRKHGKGATLVGALCYVFCGYAVFWAILRHPHFFNAATILPLVLFGADRLFDGKRPTAFVVAIAMAFFMSFYFAFMTVLAVLVYCVAQYFFGDRKRSVSDFFKIVGKFLASSLLGAAIAGISIAPYVISVFSTSRGSGGLHMSIPMFFEPYYYRNIVSNFIGGKVTDANARFIGAPAVLMLIVFLSCGKHFDKHERRPMLFCLFVSLLAVLLPYLSHIINGFNYTTDRWMYTLAFFTSVSVCMTVPVLGKLTPKEWRRVGIGAAVVAVASLLPITTINAQSVSCTILFAILAIAMLALRKKLGYSRALSVTLAACVIVSVALPSFFVLSTRFGQGYQNEMLDRLGTAYQTYTSGSPFSVVNKAPKDLREQYRYSMTSMYSGKYRMESLNQTRQGLDSYSSNYNQNIENFRKEVGLSDNFFSNVYYGSDARLALDAFSAAKYYVCKESGSWLVPNSYEYTGNKKGDYQLYETDYALPLAFSYDKAISRDAYEQLDMVEKQEAILSGCVLENSSIDSEATVLANVETHAVRPSCNIELGEGVSFADGKLRTSKTDATITLHFEAVPNAETYVCFEDVMLDSSTATVFEVVAQSKNGKRTVEPITPNDRRRYGGKTKWVVNMGYSDEGISEVTLTFDKKGTYSVGDLYIECQPVEPVKEKLRTLQEHGLTDIVESKDGISGVVKTESDFEYVLFTFGYTSGWSATVDGEPAKALKADTGFVAVPVKGAGEHTVALSYKIPGFDAGCIASICGVAVGIALLLISNRKRKRS